MRLGRNSSRALLALTLAGLSFLILPGRARAKAKPGKHRASSNETVGLCVTNYKTGLDREQAAKLVEARELFIRCSKAACGSPLREECTIRFTQLTAEIPSVVPVVSDATGRPQTDVAVNVDGDRLTSSLDGHSFWLDPGVREFSFSKDGHIFATQTVMIVQGQRNRLISASLQPDAPADTKRPLPQRVAAADKDTGGKPIQAPVVDKDRPPVEKLAGVTSDDAPPALKLTTPAAPVRRRTPRLSYVLAGAGLASLGAGALLTVWGRSDTNTLGVCSPGCPQSSADHIHTLYVAADVSIGVGIAALAASYWAYAHSRASQEGQEEQTALRTAPTMIGVQPTSSGGALGTLSGSF